MLIRSLNFERTTSLILKKIDQFYFIFPVLALGKKSLIDTESSGYDFDDNDENSHKQEKQRFGLGKNTLYSGVFTSIQNEYDMEEEDHNSYPIYDFLNKIYDKFHHRPTSIKNTKKTDPAIREYINHEFTFFSSQPYYEESIQIPEVMNPTIEKAIIHLLDIQCLPHSNHSKFIHSWCDISSVSKIEAKRIIPTFLCQSYKKIDPKSFQLNTEISWSRNFSSKHTKFYRSNQMSSSLRIFHYIGLGLPNPQPNNISMRSTGNLSTSYVNLDTFISTFTPPCMLIFDCSQATVLMEYLNTLHMSFCNPESGKDRKSDQAKLFFALFACSEKENLLIPTDLPQNFFTCILLSPDRAFSAITGIHIPNPSIFEDLLAIFTNSIALDSLPTETFYLLFRNNPTVSSLWRRFLLAQRLMKTFGLNVRSIPDLPDMSEHYLWDQFEYSLRSAGIQDPIKFLSDIYLSSFDFNETPPHYACAMVTTLLPIPNIHFTIMRTLAKFMEKSPMHCKIVASFMNYKYLDVFSSVRVNKEEFYYWCVVLSGVLLVAPSLGSSLNNKVFFQTEAIHVCLDRKNYDEKIRVLLLSILVSIRDQQEPIQCYFSPRNSTDQFVPHLFNSSPFLREWIVLYVNSALYRYMNNESRTIAHSNIHAYALILLYERRVLTRACSINILSRIMDKNAHEFNETIITLALKASVDGSSVVRYAFLCCLARLANMNQISFNHLQTSNNDKPQKKFSFEYDSNSSSFQINASCEDLHIDPDLDFIIRDDPLSFARVIEPDEPKPFKDLINLFSKILMNMCYDPNLEVRNFAKQLIQNPINQELQNECNSYSKKVHKMAHSLLFLHSIDSSEMEQRYQDKFITSNHLERFEVINTRQTMISLADSSNDNNSADDFAFPNANNPFSDLDFGFAQISAQSSGGFPKSASYTRNSSSVLVAHDDDLSQLSTIPRSDSAKLQPSGSNLSSNMLGDFPQFFSYNLVPVNDKEQKNLSSGTFPNEIDGEITEFHVVATCFDIEHNNVIIATSNGYISWGDNHWFIESNFEDRSTPFITVIHSIVSLPKLSLAVATNNGIYIYRNGFSDPIDSFQPSIIPPSELTIMEVVRKKSVHQSYFELYGTKPKNKSMCYDIPETTLLYIAQGNNEILVWDIEALIMIKRIKVPSPPTALQCIKQHKPKTPKVSTPIITEVKRNEKTKEKKVDSAKKKKHHDTTDEIGLIRRSKPIRISPNIDSIDKIADSDFKFGDYDRVVSDRDSSNSDSDMNCDYNSDDTFSYDMDSIDSESDSNDDNDDEEEIEVTETDDDENEYFIFASLQDGTVIKIDTSTNEIVQVNEMYKNGKFGKILRIGNYGGNLYSVSNNGPLFLWKDFQFPQQIVSKCFDSPLNDLIVHPVYPLAIRIDDQTVTLIHLFNDYSAQISSPNSDNGIPVVGTCCSFDGTRPLCAIGYSNGDVGIWRVLIPENA